MSPMTGQVIIGLSTVVVAIRDHEAVVLTVRPDDLRTHRASAAPGLPSGPFDPDHDRTFEGVEEPQKFLQGMYNALTTGVHLDDSGGVGFKDPAFTGPGNAAKKASAARCETSARGDDAAGSESRADGRAGAELRAA